MEEDVSIKVLSEEILKSMSRHIRQIVPQSEPSNDQLKELKATLVNVFNTAERPDLGTTHRVAAWNTLCAITDQCCCSLDEKSRAAILDHSALQRALDLFLNQGQNARPKSAKQLLQTLSRMLHDSRLEPSVIQSIAETLMQIVSSEDDHVKVKLVLQAFAHFLRKESLTLKDALSAFETIRHRTAVIDEVASLQELHCILFAWVSKGDFGAVVSQVISATLDKADSNAGYNTVQHPSALDATSTTPIWADPLERALQSDSVEADEFKAHVFPAIFMRKLQDYTTFLQRHGVNELVTPSNTSRCTTTPNQSSQHDLLHAALQTGKELGLIYETNRADLSQSTEALFLPIRSIGRLLPRSSRKARLTGLSLLVVSHSITRPLPDQAFKLIRRHLYHFLADTDANFRSEVFSLMQKLLDRIRAITAVLARQVNSSSKHAKDHGSNAVLTLHYHQEFLKWLLRFLTWELRPTASYQTHLSALKLLSIIARSGLDDTVPNEQLSKSALGESKWPFHVHIVTPELQEVLLDLVLNPFDDVRQTSASILSLFRSSHNRGPNATTQEQLSQAVNRAERMMLISGRADQADGVAHLYCLRYSHDDKLVLLNQLVEKLENMLDVAKLSIANAVQRYPLHGLLTSLRYILSQSNSSFDSVDLLHRLSTCIRDVWAVVRPVLCNDAPEGYLLDDDDNGESTPDSSTKDVLSYSWRALKESSLLLATLVSKPGVNPASIWSWSDLCFTQLADLRHRGAFSTVAQTWITCCIRCRKTDSSNEHGPLKTWYLQIIEILKGEGTINTRRSAGIPSLVCGILIAEPSSKLFSQIYNDLAHIAFQPVDSDNASKSSLPQVHALNCIKDILKHSRLAEQSERYITQSLGLAAASIRSETWAVRNCGLMLFRAVIDRLLGTSDVDFDNERSPLKYDFTRRHPELLDVALDVLRTVFADGINISTGSDEGVFPPLQLLQRAQLPNEKRHEVQRTVFAFTASKSWHVRDKAARVYVSMTDGEDTKDTLLFLLRIRNPVHNYLHGILLCVKYLILRLRSFQVGFRTEEGADHTQEKDERAEKGVQLWDSVSSLVFHLYDKSKCDMIRAACVDIITELLLSYDHANSSSMVHWAHYRRETNTFRFPNICGQVWNVVAGSRATTTQGVLRRSLARASAVELSTLQHLEEHHVDHTVHVILLFASSDADACSLFFETLRSTMQIKALTQTLESDTSGLISELKTCIILVACAEIQDGNYGITLKCEVQRLLLDLPISSLHLSVSNLEYYLAACQSGPAPTEKNCNQQYADQWLQLQAAAFEHSAHSVNDSDVDVRNWIHLCIMAVQEEGLHTREAAALAISRLDSSWKHLRVADPASFRLLCFSVYDLLNDDDEDIRDLASRTTTRIINTCSSAGEAVDLQPAEARQRLLRFMVKEWSQNRAFFSECFQRAFGQPGGTWPSVDEQLKALSAVDTALFAEERQNLYIDDALEVKIWSEELINHKLASISYFITRDIGHWVVNGLDTLAQRLESNSELFWNANPAIFTLCMKVICAAEVLLNLAIQGIRLFVRPSTITLYLVRLIAATKASGIHSLWIREAERVVCWSLVSTLRKRGLVIDEIENDQALTLVVRTMH